MKIGEAREAPLMNSAYSARKRGPILAPKTVVILRRLSVYGSGRDALITRRTLISTRFATIRISWRPVLRRYYVPQIRRYAAIVTTRGGSEKRRSSFRFFFISDRISSPGVVRFCFISNNSLFEIRFVQCNEIVVETFETVEN